MQLPPEIKPNQSAPLLQALHILTRDGKLNQDSRRKLKQVYHLVNFIEPLLQQVLLKQDNPTLVDHGAGKSYLGFILYDLLLKQLPAGRVIGIETRADLVQKSQMLAQECQFERMSFEHLTVADNIDQRLDTRGERINHRLDARGERIDNRLDRQGERINKRLDRRAKRH